MEDKIELGKVLNTYEELHEAALIYENCINLDDLEYLVSPLLKYALFQFNLFEAFKDRLTSLSNDIENLKNKLKICKREKIDVNKEIKRLDVFSDVLRKFEMEANEAYDFYSFYLGKVAKEYDDLNNNLTKNVYVKSSEEIIFALIKYYL